MPVTRRTFLAGAPAIAMLATLNRAHAGRSAEAIAADESFWAEIRAAYPHDPELLNLNNGGVAPAPASVLDAQIADLRYSNQAPAYRMWRDLEPRIEAVRKEMARMWNADPE